MNCEFRIPDPENISVHDLEENDAKAEYCHVSFSATSQPCFPAF